MNARQMRVSIVVRCTLFCCVGLVRPAAAQTNAILIGWDGCQRDHLKQCIARGEVPNLMRLAKQGALVAIDIARTTDTKAGWAQILTGYEPEKTGVFSNGRFRPIPVGYTIFERLETHVGPDKIATVAIIGKKGHVDADPPRKTRVDEESKKPGPGKKAGAARRPGARKRAGVATRPGARKRPGAARKPGAGKRAGAGKKAGAARPKQQRAKKKQPGRIVEENGVKYRVVPGKPYYHTKDHIDVWMNGLQHNDKVGRIALEHLERYKDQPFFFFVHFADPDHAGHKHGENSKQYNDAIISDDTWTGRIMDKLKELGLADKTLIYVTADHGFDEGQKSHRDAPYVFLATNDPKVIRRGQRKDITPTILDRLGVDPTKIDPPLDGRSLARPYTPPKW